MGVDYFIVSDKRGIILRQGVERSIVGVGGKLVDIVGEILIPLLRYDNTYLNHDQADEEGKQLHEERKQLILIPLYVRQEILGCQIHSPEEDDNRDNETYKNLAPIPFLFRHSYLHNKVRFLYNTHSIILYHKY